MKLFYVLWFFLLVIFSCSKDKNVDPTPNTKSNLTGYVQLYDEGMTKIDNAAMDVSIVGISPSISAKTDANGTFTLLDVPFGKYTLLYEKTGFGTFKKINYEHKDNTTFLLHTTSLGQKSTTQVTQLEVNVNSNDVVLSVTTNPAGSIGNSRYVRCFLSTSPIVSDTNYSYYSPVFISQINPKALTLSKSDLVNAGFSSGVTVYAKVYGDSYWSNDYFDSDLGKNVFPNLNDVSATPVSFVVP